MNADLHAVEVREIAVQQTFVDFEDFWTTSMMAATVNQAIAAMAPGDAELLKMRMRARLPADVAGRITHDARANAIRGRVPKVTAQADVRFGVVYGSCRSSKPRPLYPSERTSPAGSCMSEKCCIVPAMLSK
jgi:hypothetical protein